MLSVRCLDLHQKLYTHRLRTTAYADRGMPHPTPVLRGRGRDLFAASPPRRDIEDTSAPKLLAGPAPAEKLFTRIT